MESRERVLKAIHFQEPDRVPLDIGGARTCNISITAYKRLVDHLGITLPEVEIASSASRLAKVDEAVYRKLGVDVRPVGISNPSNWKFKLHADENFTWYRDEWGRKLMMPKDKGYYFDTMDFPLEKIDLEDYHWPDPADESRFKGVSEKARHILEHIGAAAVAPNCLANGFLQMGAKLYGYSCWFLMLAAEPAKAEKFMDTKRLKKEFGADLVFWGGGVDTQKILPFGTPQEVSDEVKRRIDDLAPGGGFVFAAVHNIQADVPPENIMAMVEALDRYGQY